MASRLSKNKIKVDLWQKDIAPSNSLRKWFGHDEKKWDEFKRRYLRSWIKKEMLLTQSLKTKEQHSVTLLYATKEEKFNECCSFRKKFVKKKIKNK